jgi:hypothetical protein
VTVDNAGACGAVAGAAAFEAATGALAAFAHPNLPGPPPSAPGGRRGRNGKSALRTVPGRPTVTAMGAPLSPSDAAPPLFAPAADALRQAIDSPPRPDVGLRELPAPTRVAPSAFALSGSLNRDGEQVASGRLILLADARGQTGWEGTLRFVCYAQAEIDPDIARDPLLPDVAWSWLGDALAAHGVAFRALGGTVTTTASRRFGALAADGDGFDLELRCSWSPDWTDSAPGGGQVWTAAGTVAHLSAFTDLLAAMAGLPPRMNGVVPLPDRRT